MTSEDSAKAQVSKILGSSKETEFLQSFVRVDRGSDDDAHVRPKKSELHLPKQNSFEFSADGDQKGSSPRQGTSSKQVSGKTIFKQIKKEMKNKGSKRRRARREEEVYTDKDRAAAVNMGSKDIKQSLSMKLKQDRTKALQLPDKADPNTLLALGRNELKSGKIETAISFVNKALELNPEEKSALVARSKCYLLLGEPNLALEDAEAALKMDKSYIKAIYQKAEALYYLGDFELSLMFYHRGLRLRPELEGFRLGVQKAQEAIENTIGHSRPLIDVKSVNNSITSTPVEKTHIKNTNDKKNKDQDKKLARQLLGQLCVDKEYLENLIKNPNLNVANRKSNNIIVHAEEAVEFLNKRQEFWRQQKSTATTGSKKKLSKPIDNGPLPKWFDQNQKLT